MENFSSSVPIENIESQPKMTISFSVDREILRVEQTLYNLEWLREHYGDSNTKLPAMVSKNSSYQEIAEAVESEFSKEKYDDFVVALEDGWKGFAYKLENLKGLSLFRVFPKYSVILTRYGSGGSYNPSTGEVIVNIEFRSKDKAITTVAHEVVHVGIDPLIEKYNVPHWRKERLVDLICNKYFPDISKTQNIKEDVSFVDEVFGKYFPDLDAITLALRTEPEDTKNV